MVAVVMEKRKANQSSTISSIMNRCEHLLGSAPIHRYAICDTEGSDDEEE